MIQKSYRQICVLELKNLAKEEPDREVYVKGMENKGAFTYRQLAKAIEKRIDIGEHLLEGMIQSEIEEADKILATDVLSELVTSI